MVTVIITGSSGRIASKEFSSFDAAMEELRAIIKTSYQPHGEKLMFSVTDRDVGSRELNTFRELMKP